MIYLHPPSCDCPECAMVLVGHERSDAFCDVLDVLVDEWGAALFAWPGDVVERLVWWCAGTGRVDC